MNGAPTNSSEVRDPVHADPGVENEPSRGFVFALGPEACDSCHVSDSEAARFFDSYVAAFERFDGDAVADHFHFPLHVTGHGDPVDVRSVPDRAAWMETLNMLLDVYRGFGVTTAHTLERSTVALSDRVLQVAVHWSLRDGADREVYDFNGVYTLVRDGDTWRVTAVAHDELPKIMERLS